MAKKTVKKTYAVVISCPPSLLLPGFVDDVKQYHPFFDPARMMVRAHLEIARLEIDGITEAEIALGFNMLYRAAAELAWQYLGQNGPVGMGFEEAREAFEGQEPLASVSLIEVENLPVPTPHGLQPVENSVRCPTCGGPMVLRSGRHGKFYGCTHYPDCKGIRNA